MSALRSIEGLLAGGAVLFGVLAGGGRPPWATLALFLAAIPAAAVALWCRRDGGRHGVFSSAVLAAALAGVLALGVIVRPPLAAFGWIVASIGVFGFLIGGRAADGGPRWPDRLLAGIALLGFAEGVLALYQSFALGEASDPTGTFTNRNHLAGFLNLSIAVCLGQLAAPGRRRATAGGGLATVRSVATIGAIAVMGLAIVRSRSRGGALVLVAILILAAALVAWRRRASRRSGSPWTVVAALAIVLGLGAIAGADRLAHRFARIEANDRPQLYADTLKMIADRPWTGVGGGMYRWRFRSYQTASLELWYTHAHNDYLEVAADWGAPIAVLLFSCIGWQTWRVGRRYLAARDPAAERVALACTCGLTALLLHGVVDFNLHIPANLFVFAILLGVAASGSPPATASDIGRGSWHGRALRIGIIIAIVGAGVAVVPRLRAELLLRDAESLDDLQRAIELAPELPSAHFRLGVAYRDSPSLRQLAASRAHLERAVELNPHAWRYWWELAHLEEASGAPAAAERALDRAVALNPRSGLYRWRWANYLLRRGDVERMLDQVHHALTIDSELRAPAWQLLSKLDLPWAERAAAWPDDGFSRLVLLELAAAAPAPPPTAALLEEWRGLLAAPERPPLRRTGFFIDLLLERDQPAQARREWVALTSAYGQGDDDYAAQRESIWNGDFERPLSRSGLGWRSRPVDGLTVGRVEDAASQGTAALRLVMTDAVPASAPLLRQRTVLSGPAGYRLRYRMRSEEGCDGGGIAIQLRDVATRRLLATDEVRGNKPWFDRSAVFEVPSPVTQVELLFRRVAPPPVDTLCRGSAWLDAVRLEPIRR